MVFAKLIDELISGYDHDHEYEYEYEYVIINENKHSVTLKFDGIGIFMVNDFTSYTDQIDLIMKYVINRVKSNVAFLAIRKHIPNYIDSVKRYTVRGYSVLIVLSSDSLTLTCEPLYELKIALQDGCVIDTSIIDVFFECILK